MSTVFSDIVAGKIPVQRVAENQQFLAFLERKPVNPGHTLVIPKKEIDYFFDLSDSALSEFMIFSKKVAAAIKQAIPCTKVGVMVAGMEVRHAHVHLIPIQSSAKELNFEKAKDVPATELEEIAAKIREIYSRLYPEVL